MPAGRRRPLSREYTAKVHQVHKGSRTLRTTIPEPICAILDVRHGDTVVFIVEPGSGKVTFQRQ